MKKIVLFIIFSLALASCGRSSDSDKQWRDASGILRFIPADSPLIAVRLTPFPEEFLARFAGQNALLRDANRDALADLTEADASGSNALPDGLLETIQRLNRLSTTDGAASAGIAPDAQAAIYWVGAQPVARIALNDQAGFEQFVTDLASEIPMRDAELKGQPYRYFELGSVRVALLIADNYAVATLAPESAADAALDRALGLTLPDANVADDGLLAELAKKHGLTGGQLGYLHPVDLFDAVGGSSGLLRQLAADVTQSGQLQSTALSPECLADVRRWQSAVSAVTVGYSDAGSSGLKGAMAVDLAPSIAKDLVGLAQPVPGLGVPSDALISVGFSLDIETLRGFVEKRVASVLEKPYRCPAFAGFNQQAEQLSGVLARQPTPPSARDFRGFSVSLDRVSDGTGLTLDALRTASFSWILSTDSPESLVTLGNLFVPQIAALNLKPDGQIVEVPQGFLNPTGQRMKIAMTDDRLIGAVGPDAETKLVSLRAMSADSDAPVFAIDVDAGAYVDLYGEQMLSLAPGGASLLEEMKALYSRQSMRVRTTKHGVRFDVEIKLKEEAN